MRVFSLFMLQVVSPILSVIIISHNQRDDLQRCLDSIVSMPLTYPYEIIVSDDRSTDGSYELACRYAQSEALKQGSLLRIVALQCNSDEGDVTGNSQRSGYNRCNAYPHAQGKYIAHVDADDYFVPEAAVYEKQIAALEQHPECALAMSNCLCLNEGDELANARPWILPRAMKDGEILSENEFIQGNFFRINQCFMQRRQADVDPVARYGKRYVDSVITYHHLQFGKVVYVKACDYVYVGHQQSVTGQMAKADHDSAVMWCLAVYIPMLIPKWKNGFLSRSYFPDLRHVIRLALQGYRMKESNVAQLRDLDVFLYRCFNAPLSLFSRLRLYMALAAMHLPEFCQPAVLYRLLIGELYPKVEQFLRFCIVGTVATAAHYAIYLALLYGVRLDALWWKNAAYAIGYISAFFGNLWLTAHFTFRRRLTVKRSGGFLFSHAITFFSHLLLFNLFLWAGVPQAWVPVPVILIATLINFLLIRFVFTSNHFQSDTAL